eukprot:c13622_g1_i3.p1 GENE.c13622_g1_i3~~c13622_g1_i3.p1  ORF type:complete len:428 (+),score=89.00 c13622_g1_i3:393-1676(+)
MVIITSPEAAQEVLIRKNPMKSNQGYKDVRSILGRGLVTALPEPHKPRRRLLETAFGAKYLKQTIFGAIIKLTDEFLGAMESRIVESKQPELVVNVGAEMTKLTMDVICVSGFDVDPKLRLGSKTEYTDLVAAWVRVLRELTQRMRNPMRSIMAPLTTLQHFRDIKYIRNLMGEIIHKRVEGLKGGEECRTDLLGVMLQSDPPLSVDQITDEVTTFNLAGQDTTALLLSWAIYRLALDKTLQQKCRREAKRALQGERVLTHDPNPSDVPTIEAVLRECLRLYPPAPGTNRQFETDVEITGIRIPAGTEILVSTAVLGVRSDWGSDALEWNPNRFLGAEGQLLSIEESAPHPMSYAPFSIGARSCIGRYFATMEARAVVMMLLDRFDLLGRSAEMKCHPGMVQETTLKPARPILVRLRPHDPTDKEFA